MRSNIELYELDGYNVDGYGLLDPFRKIINGFVEKIVESGKWFSFCTKASDAQVDIMSIQNNKGVKMGRMVSEKNYSESVYRVGVYKQFMRSYMCFCEYPTVKKSYSSGGYSKSYEKCIVTSNVCVIADWLGIPLFDSMERYAGHMDASYDNTDGSEFPYVKLYTKKSGERAVTKPRTCLDLSMEGLRIVPMFAINTGISRLYGKCRDMVCRVRFIKDGGVERVLDVSSSSEILESIYGRGDYFYKGFEESYDGSDIRDVETVCRGYLRFIEVGGSRYDNPSRSVNFCRIIGIEYGVDPDLTFVNIDIDSVLDSFKDSIENKISSIENIKLRLVDDGIMTLEDSKSITGFVELQSWVDLKSVILGSTFVRSIALFMLMNPVYFPDYTGEPKIISSSSEGTSSGDSVSVDDGIGVAFDFLDE